MGSGPQARSCAARLRVTGSRGSAPSAPEQEKAERYQEEHQGLVTKQQICRSRESGNPAATVDPRFRGDDENEGNCSSHLGEWLGGSFGGEHEAEDIKQGRQSAAPCANATTTQRRAARASQTIPRVPRPRCVGA